MMDAPTLQSAGIMAPSSDAEEGLSGVTAGSGSLAGSNDCPGESTAKTKDSACLSKGPTTAEWKELLPLVAMPPPSEAAVTNRLSKKTYSRLGRNLLFEARPAVVHFGGYTLGRAHSQRVRVVNVSRTSQRLHILGPSTDSFKMRCNKKGVVAPGSSEVIMVDFHPREHRYHYDCVRLHTDSENLLIPLHAYPVMNDVVFPTRLDFGVHALGETIRRTVKMVCKVPIQFEFEIEVTKTHPHFHIGPLRGIVPANGAAEVYVEHTPTSGNSAEMELLVSVSQFNFKPTVCVVTGAGRPGVVRQDALYAAASRLGGYTLENSLGDAGRAKSTLSRRREQRGRNVGRGDGAGRPTEDFAGTMASNDEGAIMGPRDWGNRSERMVSMPRRGGEYGGADSGNDTGVLEDFEMSAGQRADMVDTWATRDPSAEQHPYGTGKGSGAVFDVGGKWLMGEKLGHGAPQQRWMPPTDGAAFGSNVEGPLQTTEVEGFVIPARLNTVQATNFVLTQQPGKLKPNDLKEAIRRARADRERQLQEQEALRALTASGEEEQKEGDVSQTTRNITYGVGGKDGGYPRKDSDPTGTNHRGVGTPCDINSMDRPPCAAADTVAYGDTRAGVASSPRVPNAGPTAILAADIGGERRRRRHRQPAQLSGKAICAYENTMLGVGSATSGVEREGREGGVVASRQLKEMSFLQDLAMAEAEERDRSFKASIEHVGEPVLTQKEIFATLEERKKCQDILGRKRRAAERRLTETCFKGPGEVGARFAKATILLTGSGTQGSGFDHVPDWDIYKNDDWGKRREVLRRLVNLVGRWIVRRRAGRRLAAIQVRLGDLRSRAEVAAMVERDTHQAKLTAGPTTSTTRGSWETTDTIVDDDSWDFPDPLVTSLALADEMLWGSIAATSDGRHESGDGESFTRVSSMSFPSPPGFCLRSRDIQRHRFPIYEEGAVLSRREEAVDESGPPTDFVDIDLLPLREPEEGKAMGFECVRPPGPGEYPSVETSRPLRWSAFEECGVRQPRDNEEEASRDLEVGDGGIPNPSSGWRQALSSTDRRSSKATLGRRRSSVGLRMVPTTVENPEEAWLVEAEAELTALAAEAEKVSRIPDALLRRPPPPGGVDLITPDPRFKGFLPELPMDEASPEWCLRPQEIPREVPVTKGLLLGYAPGSTTLRAYADAPRLSTYWKPKRERRSSGLACMRGQASRGVWQPVGRPSMNWRHNGRDKCDGTVARHHQPFRLSCDVVDAATAAGDELSDSESEDDEGDIYRPTPAEARVLFDATAVSEGEDIHKSGNSGEEMGLNECRSERTKQSFARDDATAALEAASRCKRDMDADVLGDRMGAISAEVKNIKHAFVLQTPYHRLHPRSYGNKR